MTLAHIGKQPIVIGPSTVPMQLTYVDNLIDAMIAAAGASVPSGRIYDIVDQPELSQGEVRTAVIDVSSGDVRPFLVPTAIAWLAMGASDVLGMFRRRQLGTARYRLRRTIANIRFRTDAARSELGWQPKVTFREALQHTIAATREDPYPH